MIGVVEIDLHAIELSLRFETLWMSLSCSVVSVRSHALAEAGCVMSLKKLAEDASPATRQRVALCFRRLATEPLNRGLIVQQGGLVSVPLTQGYYGTVVAIKRSEAFIMRCL